MKFSLLLALVVAPAAAMKKPIMPSREAAEYAVREMFSSFEERFEKKYDAEEREHRFLIFLSNLEMVVEKNAKLAAKGKDEVHGITKFSDLTKEEFVDRMLMKPSTPSNSTRPVAIPLKSATDSSFDWRDSGMVTSVKDQGYCGSCWAHSAVETLESAYAIAGGDLTALSVQQVTSCDTTDSGCSGGWYYTAWEDYVESAGGLATESDYPYDTATYGGTASTCASSDYEMVDGTTPSGYMWATDTCSSVFCNSQDEDTLKDNLVSYGPVSIAADASDWSSYTSGILTSDDCSSSAYKLDHAIQLVGYNEDGDTPYWIVRNSWSSDWGIDGYLYLEMGENTCGLADKAAIVTL